MKRCGELMSVDLKWVSATASASEAARLMRDHSVGFLPVCDPANGRLVAVVTDRDLAIRLNAAGVDGSRTPVSEVATPAPVACYEDTPLSVAEEGMARHHISRVVVVDPDMHPVGVLSLTDVVMKDSGWRALRAARGVLEREADGPHPPLSEMELAPEAWPEHAPGPGEPSAETLYHTSGPAQSRDDYITGGRTNRATKEFPG